MPVTGGFGVIREQMCAPTELPPRPLSDSYYLYCALTSRFFGFLDGGAQLAAGCSDNPFDASDQTWVSPGGEGRLFVLTQGVRGIAATEKFNLYNYGASFALRSGWAVPPSGTALPIAVDLTGTYSPRLLQLESITEEALDGRVASGSPYWIEVADHQVLGAQRLADGRTFLIWIDVRSGPVVATRVVDHALRLPPVSSDGQVYASATVGNRSLLFQFDSSLNEVSRRFIPRLGVYPIAAFADRALLSSGEVVGRYSLSDVFVLPEPFDLAFMTDAFVTAVDREPDRTTVRIHDAASGAVASEESVPFAVNLPPMVTAEGTVILVREAKFIPDYMSFQAHSWVWIHEVGRGGGSHPLGQSRGLPVAEGAFLWQGSLVLRQREDGHNNYHPLPFLLRFPLPGVTAPSRGWLTPSGNSRGTFSPE